MHPMYAVTFALKTRGEFPILQDLKEFAHFTALGANLGALGSILEPLGAHLGRSGGGLGGLGVPFGGSGAILE